MNNNASENYLVNEVMSAAPQKLHLMLLDAAIRECQRAQKHWQTQEDKQAEKCLLHAQRIIMGIIGGIDFEVKTDLISNVAGVYLFICQTLTRAFMDKDQDKLAEALRVLAVERETWRQLCEQLGASAGQTTHQTGHTTHAPVVSPNDETMINPTASSFSLEA